MSPWRLISMLLASLPRLLLRVSLYPFASSLPTEVFCHEYLQTGGTIRSPKLDLQLKCHSSAPLTAQTLSYPLKIKNYDDLRDESVMVPRILVVVIIPEQVAQWTNHSESELALRRCGYWLSIRGQPPAANTTTVSVAIDRARQFSAEALTQIMGRIATGGLP